MSPPGSSWKRCRFRPRRGRSSISGADLLASLAAGGDDYELLFAAPAGATKAIEELSSVLGLPITMIGRIEPGEGVRLVDADGRTIPVGDAGYRHF